MPNVVWNVLRTEGPMTIVEVMIEPGRTAEIPVRTDIVGTQAMQDLITVMFDRHEETRDQLRDFT